MFYGIDRREGPTTSDIVDICNFLPSSFLEPSEEYVVMHLAACRNDFGVAANIYFHDNVTATQRFCLIFSAHRKVCSLQLGRSVDRQKYSIS